MKDYEGAQANIATNLLLEAHSSTKYLDIFMAKAS